VTANVGTADGVRHDTKLTIGVMARALLWVVYAWLLVNLALLLAAFVLRLLGANPEAGFTEWVYRSVQRTMAPFRGIFEPLSISDQSVLDTSLLFAMIVYGFIALCLRAAVMWVSDWISDRRAKLEDRELLRRQLQLERELRARLAQHPSNVWEQPAN
jgi:Na+-translocating ferredoxin:NAD+ oxidoreductase RnfA subunit